MSHTLASRSVPKLSNRFLKWALPDDLIDPVLGDLEEEFFEKILINQNYATNWYRKQAIQTGLQFVCETKKGLLMFIISVFLFVALTLLAMWLGGGVDMFINIPSFLVVLPPTIAFTIAATSWQDVMRAFSQLTHSHKGLDQDLYKNSRQVFIVMGNSAMLLAFFMTLICVVSLANSINAENFSQVFGPAFAVSILTLLYGVGIKVVCYVAEQKIISLSGH